MRAVEVGHLVGYQTQPCRDAASYPCYPDRDPMAGQTGEALGEDAIP